MIKWKFEVWQVAYGKLACLNKHILQLWGEINTCVDVLAWVDWVTLPVLSWVHKVARLWTLYIGISILFSVNKNGESTAKVWKKLHCLIWLDKLVHSSSCQTSINQNTSYWSHRFTDFKNPGFNPDFYWSLNQHLKWASLLVTQHNAENCISWTSNRLKTVQRWQTLAWKSSWILVMWISDNFKYAFKLTFILWFHTILGYC